MGNDQSHLKGLETDKKATEVTDFWSIYSGEVPHENNPPTLISIFKGEPVITGQLWTNKSPLERATRNLMIYRHPSILRFITSWEKGSVHYLATERCKPLSMVVSTQNDIQICLGLRNILCSLIFLVEKAGVCHLNVCTSSIYVVTNGAWRLGGFEHLWPRKEVTTTLLERSQPYRYKNAIDRDETKREEVYGIEQFAFGVLCEEILSNRKDSLTIPNVAEFRKFCVENLRNSNGQKRPSLHSILMHPYFNQEFILIHLFLSELPLKQQSEKQTFFTSLVDRLRDFDETVVAAELIDLILSRIVLLDDIAKLCVIPFVLKPRTDCDSLETPLPIFSIDTFTRFVAPKIQQLFLVRDIQIRLVLLEYFPAYMNYFDSEDTLSKHILPQLLLGIKDTNDQLVAATLRCLADLVPVLGSSTVIGRNRGRLFADGRPNGTVDKSLTPTTMPKWTEPRSITPVLTNADGNLEYLSASPMPDHVDISDSFVSQPTTSQNLDEGVMPERLSPDGGEDIRIANDQADIDDEAWSDWENDAIEPEINNSENMEFSENAENIHPQISITNITNHSTTSNTGASYTHDSSVTITNDIKDIKDIEIKSTKSQPHDEIDDFFKEMEPVIAMTNSILILADNTQPKVSDKNESHVDNDFQIDKNRFAIKDNDDDNAFDDAAWGNETSDWDVDS